MKGQMTYLMRTRALAVFAVSTSLISLIAVSPSASAAKRAKPEAPAAATPADPAAQQQNVAAAAHAAYEAGVKSYQGGKYEPAVQSFTAALRGGGLASTDMAHALYYRGLAYKRQSKPGLAISDLTSALWLKNGLGDSERASATAERAEAYRLAGLGDGNSGTETVAVADPNLAAAKTEAPKSEAPKADVSKNEVPSRRSAARADTQQATPDGTSMAAIADQVAAPAAPAQVVTAAPETTNFQNAISGVAQSAPAARTASVTQPRASDLASHQVAAVSQMDAAVPAPIPVAAAAPVEGPVAAAPGTPSTVSGFFSNLFGTGKSQAAAPITTASTEPAVPVAAKSNGASVASGEAAKAAKMTAPAQSSNTGAAAGSAVAAAAPAAATAVKGGKYKIHIAAVRSRAEAEALANKLSQQHGNMLATRTPTVDEAVIGSMGTFYRVRVGSFATAEEPRGLCNTLRTSGYDCLVVTN